MSQNLFKVGDVRRKGGHEPPDAVFVKIAKIQAADMVAQRQPQIRRDIRTPELCARVIKRIENGSHKKQRKKNDAVNKELLRCEALTHKLNNRNNHQAEHAHVKDGIHTR